MAPPPAAEVDRLRWLKRRGLTAAMTLVTTIDAAACADAFRRGLPWNGAAYALGVAVFASIGIAYWRQGR
jgi:hypothetical protein